MNYVQQFMTVKESSKWRRIYLTLSKFLIMGTVFLVGLYLFDLVLAFIKSYWLNNVFEKPSANLEQRILSTVIFVLIMGILDWTGNKADRHSESK
jgi:Na+/H+ antiporter NhaC